MRTTEDTNANDTANDRCFRTVKYNAKGKDDADTKVLHIQNPTDFKHIINNLNIYDYGN